MDLIAFEELIKKFNDNELNNNKLPIGLPTYRELNELVKFDSNVCYIDELIKMNYFDSFTQDEKYEIFSSACGYSSEDIVKKLYFIGLDYYMLKPLMVNYMAETGEFNLFKWIYEQDNILFSDYEIDECFFLIVQSGNIEFIKWFYKLGLINLNKNNFYTGGFVNFKDKLFDILNKCKINQLEIKSYINSLLI